MGDFAVFLHLACTDLRFLSIQSKQIANSVFSYSGLEKIFKSRICRFSGPRLVETINFDIFIFCLQADFANSSASVLDKP